MNAPVPELSEVLSEAVVGAGVVLQQTPLALTVSPPPDVTLPPPVAVICVMAVMSSVVTVGTCVVIGSVLLQEKRMAVTAIDKITVSKEIILVGFIAQGVV